MTRDRLDQYLALKKETALLEREIESLRERSSEVVTDVVSGSSSSYPYTRRTFSISGLCVKDLERMEGRMQRLQERRERISKEADEIDQFIDQVTDSQMRQIIHMKYLRGMSWGQIARHLGGGNTEDCVRKKVVRFLEK